MNPTTDTAIPLPAPFMPPGGPIEIVFSFDTTGSMSACLEQVRGQLAHVIERLMADIPGLRIAVFAHGDYCDLKEYGYVTKHVDFTNDVNQLCQFVNEVGGTGGGDFEECYELVLRQVREQLSWQPGTQKALVMIGDATPHEHDNPQNVDAIDWRLEAMRLSSELGVRTYAVQCLNNEEANDFYRHLADSSGGRHLKLDELTSIVEMMMAICYREKGAEFFEDFEREIRQREGAGMRADLDRMFVTLKDGPAAAAVPSAEPVPSTSAAMASSDDSDDDDDEPINVSLKIVSARKRRPRGGSVTSGASSPASSTTTSTSTRSTPTKGVSKRNKGIAKRTKNTPKSSLAKALRERLAQKDFVLSPLRWSHWKKAMTAAPSSEEGWRQRNGGHVGSRRSQLFEDMTEPAVYEVAVQTEDCKTKVPVLAAVTEGLHRKHWERAFMYQDHIKNQVDNVLKRGCKLYVRRAQFATDDIGSVYGKAEIDRKDNGTNDSMKCVVRELRGLVAKTCDYAWRQHRDLETKRTIGHRPLVKKGVVISE